MYSYNLAKDGTRVGTFSAHHTSLKLVEPDDPDTLLVFIDDFLGIQPTREIAQQASDCLAVKMEKVGLVESIDKRQAPPQIAAWIGFEFNT